MNDGGWGGFARRVLDEGLNPRQGKKSDQAHPPIHPTKYAGNLANENERKLYEFIVRHFLACLSKDAQVKHISYKTILHCSLTVLVFRAMRQWLKSKFKMKVS